MKLKTTERSNFIVSYKTISKISRNQWIYQQPKLQRKPELRKEHNTGVHEIRRNKFNLSTFTRALIQTSTSANSEVRVTNTRRVKITSAPSTASATSSSPGTVSSVHVSVWSFFPFVSHQFVVQQHRGIPTCLSSLQFSLRAVNTRFTSSKHLDVARIWLKQMRRARRLLVSMQQQTHVCWYVSL